MRLLLRRTREKLGVYVWGQANPQSDSKYADLTNSCENRATDRSKSATQAVTQTRIRTAVCLFLVTPIMCVMLLLLASALMILSSSPTALSNTSDNWEDNVIRYFQKYAADQCAQIPDGEKIDCAQNDAVNQESCTKRNCCWSPKLTNNSLKSRIGTPWCYYPLQYGGYSSDQPVTTPTGFTVDMHRKFKSQFRNDVQTVKMDFKLETPSRLHVKITDPKQKGFVPPYPEVPPFTGPTPSSQDYDIQVKQGSTGFNVIRKKTQEIIFKALDVGDLIYAEQFMEISAILPNGSSIYGLGEHQGPLKVNNDQNWKLITMFNRDAPPREDLNLYGSHPFYLAVEPSGNSHGFFLLNSNAIDVVVTPSPTITIRTIGGILDMYFFLGPSPADVIRQYAEIVGTPIMPPYWALGYHLCRYDYKTVNRTEQIWKQTRDAGIPFDTQWNDIDYMENYNDFTYDKVRYGGLPEFVKKVHEAGMHWVPIIDPGVSASEPAGTYPPFDEGVKRDVLVKDSKGKTFIAKVWNRVSTAFPDFTHPGVISYWTDMLKMFHDQVPFDGVWIDMNEPANFYSGTKDGCPESPLETPQYTPHIDGGKLNTHTLCMTAQQYAGKHYDTHNLYGMTEAIATNFGATQILGKRTLVISRSTFAGHGKFAGHWTGDVFSTWYDMRMSIPQILSFNMFQIPMVGADICGFNGNTTVPLCLRWSQLGAFYPFARNHNEDRSIDQDPVSMGKEVTAAARDALTLRYTLLPYLYTLFYNAHKTGDTVARPVFFEFYQDKKTLTIDEQFLWGRWLLIAPVLYENAIQVKAYLPKGIWYRFPEGQEIKSSGSEFVLEAPTTTIPILLRGGGILPLQPSGPTTTVTRGFPFYLMVAPDEDNKAEGELYWDDGESLNAAEEGKYLLVKFTLEKTILRGNPQVAKYTAPALQYVVVRGVPKKPDSVLFNGASIKEYEYNNNLKVLRINQSADLSKPFSFEWTFNN